MNVLVHVVNTLTVVSEGGVRMCCYAYTVKINSWLPASLQIWCIAGAVCHLEHY